MRIDAKYVASDKITFYVDNTAEVEKKASTAPGIGEWKINNVETKISGFRQAKWEAVPIYPINWEELNKLTKALRKETRSPKPKLTIKQLLASGEED